MISSKEIVIAAACVIYLFYTFSFALYFRATAANTFKRSQIRLHSVLIWLLPFIWIAVLKAMMNPTTKNEYGKAPGFYPDRSGHDNIGNSWVFFLHEPGSRGDSSHTPGNSGDHSHSYGYDDHGGGHDSGGSDSSNTD